MSASPEPLPDPPLTARQTVWTVVWRAGHGSTEQQRVALQQLCTAYWYPVYAFIRKRGTSQEDSEDLTQGFFGFLIRQNWFARADPERGRLRTFLFTTLQNYLRTEHQRGQAQKRGGGVDFISLDGAEDRYLQEPADPVTPEIIFHRRWVHILLERAMVDLQAEYTASNRGEIFAALRGHLGADTENSSGYEQLCEQLKMSSSALRTAVHRLRARFREHLYQHIAGTIASTDPVAIREEIRELMQHV